MTQLTDSSTASRLYLKMMKSFAMPSLKLNINIHFEFWLSFWECKQINYLYRMHARIVQSKWPKYSCTHWSKHVPTRWLNGFLNSLMMSSFIKSIHIEHVIVNMTEIATLSSRCWPHVDRSNYTTQNREPWYSGTVEDAWWTHKGIVISQDYKSLANTIDRRLCGGGGKEALRRNAYVKRWIRSVTRSQPEAPRVERRGRSGNAIYILIKLIIWSCQYTLDEISWTWSQKKSCVVIHQVNTQFGSTPRWMQ